MARAKERVPGMLSARAAARPSACDADAGGRLMRMFHASERIAEGRPAMQAERDAFLHRLLATAADQIAR